MKKTSMLIVLLLICAIFSNNISYINETSELLVEKSLQETPQEIDDLDTLISHNSFYVSLFISNLQKTISYQHKITHFTYIETILRPPIV